MPQGISGNNDEASISIFTADTWEYVWLERSLSTPWYLWSPYRGAGILMHSFIYVLLLGSSSSGKKNYRSKEGAVPLMSACFKQQLKCVNLLSQCYVLDITSDWHVILSINLLLGFYWVIFPEIIWCVPLLTSNETVFLVTGLSLTH